MRGAQQASVGGPLAFVFQSCSLLSRVWRAKHAHTYSITRQQQQQQQQHISNIHSTAATATTQQQHQRL